MMKLGIFGFLLFLFLSYTAFVYTRGTDTSPAVASSDAKAGKLVFQKYNCTSCHQFYGLGGYLGPDLTRVMSQPEKGELYVKAILKFGTARMPDFKMSDVEIGELVEYLRYADMTTRSNSRK